MEKTMKLNADEMVKLDKLFRTTKRKVMRTAAGIAIIWLILSLVPLGILRVISPSGSGSSADEDESQNIIQTMGTGAWLIALIALIGLFTYLLIRKHKVFPLKKDLEEGEKLEIDVVIIKKLANDKAEDYAITVSEGTLKPQKIIVTKEQLRQFSEGQKMTLDVYKNSKIFIASVA